MIHHHRPAAVLLTSLALAVTACDGGSASKPGASAGAAPPPTTRRSAAATLPIAAPDPRDAELRAWALTLGRQLADVAAGGPVAPSLHGPSPEVDLRRPATLATLRGPRRDVHAVVVELLARRMDDAGRLAILVWTDERRAWAGGDVQWSAFRTHPYEPTSHHPLDPDVLDAKLPVIPASLQRALEVIARGEQLPGATDPVRELFGGNHPRFSPTAPRTNDAVRAGGAWTLVRVEIQVLLATPEPSMALMRSNARWLTAAITTAGDVAFPAHLSAHPMH